MLSLLGFVLAAVGQPPMVIQIAQPSFIQASAAWMTPGVICRMLPRQDTGMVIERAGDRIELGQAGARLFKSRCQSRISADDAVGPLQPGRYTVIWKGPAGFKAFIAPIVATAKDSVLELNAQATVVVHAMGVGKGACSREKMLLGRDGDSNRLVLTVPKCGGEVRRSFALSPGKWTIVPKGGALIGAWALGPSKDATSKP